MPHSLALVSGVQHWTRTHRHVNEWKSTLGSVSADTQPHIHYHYDTDMDREVNSPQRITINNNKSRLERSRADRAAEYLRVAKACWRLWDESTWNRRWEEQFLSIFYMFPHLGLKHFLLQMWERQIRVTNARVCVHTCIFLSVCVRTAWRVL